MGIAQTLFGKPFSALSAEEKRAVFKARYQKKRKFTKENGKCHQMFGKAFRKLNTEEKRQYWKEVCRHASMSQKERIAQSVFGCKVKEMTNAQYSKYVQYCVKRRKNLEKENS